MAQEEEKVETAKTKSTSQKSPLVLILLFINIAALGFVGFQQYQFMQMESKRPDLGELLKQSNESVSADVLDEQKPTETLSKETLVDLETFTVNLAQGDGPRRYVRLNAVLKMSQDSELTEIQSRKPQIRDTIISILNSKRPEDLLKRDGKIYLKEQIRSSINSYLIEGKVEDIYYVGFQIN